MDTVHRYPDRIRGLAVVNPMTRGFEEEIARCHDAGFIGVGELFPYGQIFDISESRETWRLVAACHERGMFLLLHVPNLWGVITRQGGHWAERRAAGFCANHPRSR
jgi:predicted TIM-barrel fold metal-dependent hydrolase